MQAGAALLVCRPADWVILAANARTANSGAVLSKAGFDLAKLELAGFELVGRPVQDCFGMAERDEICRILTEASGEPSTLKRPGLADLSVRCFATGGLAVLEIERDHSALAPIRDAVTAFEADIERVSSLAPDQRMAALGSKAVSRIRSLTGHASVTFALTASRDKELLPAPRILARSAANPALPAVSLEAWAALPKTAGNPRYLADSVSAPDPLMPAERPLAALDLREAWRGAATEQERIALLSRGIRTSLALPVDLGDGRRAVFLCVQPDRPKPLCPSQRLACRSIVGLLAKALIGADAPSTDALSDRVTQKIASVGQPDAGEGAFCDPVTGLPDRAGLLHLMVAQEALGADAQSPWPICLAVHVEGLEDAIERVGERSVGQLARQLALRLKSVCRRQDVLARLKPGVFAIMIAGELDRLTLRLLADRIGTLVEAPMPAGGRVMRFSCRVGIAVASPAPPKTLLADAETALREARRTEADQPVFYLPSMRDAAQRQHGRAGALYHAVRAKEFMCLYQPRIDTTTLEVRGLEAFLHWRHPTEGLVAPSDYRDLAEDLTLIEDIDALALSIAMQDRQSWHAKGLMRPPPITLCISARRLARRALIENVRDLQPPHRAFAMAFQEAALLDGLDERTRWNIEALRDLGIGIEIDAFGAAQTSLLSLMHVMPDRLKIHHLLVEPILRSETALDLVESIIEIGRTIGVGVVADGGVTMGHISYLRTMGCDLAQGAAFAPDSAADAVPALVQAPGWLRSDP